ncbi:MAG: leucyl aminopeptidase [Desulfobacterales bacterium]
MLYLKSGSPDKIKTQAIVIPVLRDHEIHSDTALSSLIGEAKKRKEFNGDEQDELIFFDLPRMKAERVIFVGMGKLSEIKAESFRRLAGNTVGKCIAKGLSEILIAVPSPSAVQMEGSVILEAIAEGATLGNHIFDTYKNEKKVKPLKKIGLLATASNNKQNQSLLRQVETICEGTILARNWVSTPSNDKKPEQFARAVAESASKEKVTVRILDEKEIKKLNMGALLAVAQGSSSKPRLLVMEYRPERAKKITVLVGKGVTFDSGGINLKQSGSIEDMKMDMAGAAAVAATLITAARLGLKKNIIGVIPIVENMPSGTAFRPGDIIKSHAGKTIEVGNTDAEGRLILVDSLSYAIKKYKPDMLIDLATLTGACMMALGDKIAGVFSVDDNLAASIVQAGEKTYERCWRLPLPDDYRELIKSDFADIKNLSSSKWGGAITAALFLSEFTEDTCWAHIDIAGPAYAKKKNAYCGTGGTGFGVRLLCELLK